MKTRKRECQGSFRICRTLDGAGLQPSNSMLWRRGATLDDSLADDEALGCLQLYTGMMHGLYCLYVVISLQHFHAPNAKCCAYDT